MVSARERFPSPLKTDEVPVVQPDDKSEGGGGDDRVADPVEGVPVVAPSPGEDSEEDAPRVRAMAMRGRVSQAMMGGGMVGLLSSAACPSAPRASGIRRGTKRKTSQQRGRRCLRPSGRGRAGGGVGRLSFEPCLHHAATGAIGYAGRWWGQKGFTSPVA